MTRPILSRFLITAVLGYAVLACNPDQEKDQALPELPGPVKVGEYVEIDIGSPAFTPTSGDMQLVWQHELTFPDATFIAPHFDHFELPAGAELTVREPNDIRSRTYTGIGKFVPGEAGFWGMHMPGKVALLELRSSVPLAADAVHLDKFSRGLEAWNSKRPGHDPDKAICGNDDSLEAKCYQQSEPDAYDKGRAVARLLIAGGSLCTGWLVGSQGHLMTNEHCIGSAGAAANTDYEFMAEGGSCNENCAIQLSCPGIVESDTATLIQLDSALDYALVELPTNITSTYGYLQLRPSGGVVGERIYIPQHPAGWGKRIAMDDGASPAVITSLNEPPCSGGPGDVGYFADTQGGSSGSPVLGYSDNKVVALHHCANCPNRGVPIDAVIADLGNNVPPGAVCSPVIDGGGDRTVCLGDPVTIGTPGLPGHNYSWSPGGQTTAQITVSPNVTTTYTLTVTNQECGGATDSVTVTVIDDPMGACAPNQANGASCISQSNCTSGNCVDGMCCNTACNGGSCEACSIANGATSDGTCELLSGVVCRAAAGSCDVAETCTGTNAACPADQLVAGGTECRASAGSCDSAEVCTGSSVDCPVDTLRPFGSTCRAAAGPCDSTEVCTGASIDCPSDTFLTGVTCRQRRDLCDVAELCEGTSIDCPPDALKPAGATCRSAFGACDAAETCDGVSEGCPADGPAAAGTMCRDAASVCDVAETCDGSSFECPADAVAPAGETCRDSVGPCDSPETCDGIGGDCPTDELAVAGTVCREAAGACDVAEVCDGAAIECPSDLVVAAGELCRDVAGDCDVAEFCDGQAGACPTDGFVAAGETCREGTGSCDPSEVCSGADGACPADDFEADGTECQVGACSNTATCQAGSCELDDGLCTAPDPSGCNASGSSGLGAGWLLLMALFVATRRRRETEV